MYIIKFDRTAKQIFFKYLKSNLNPVVGTDHHHNNLVLQTIFDVAHGRFFSNTIRSSRKLQYPLGYNTNTSLYIMNITNNNILLSCSTNNILSFNTIS